MSFTGVFGSVGSGGSGVATALGLLLLLGACGKSAQVPLQSWLLDAMEGPTPVSALIHAATMVTAGVYLLVRSNPILALTPDARLAVALVGTVTLLFGGIIALRQGRHQEVAGRVHDEPDRLHDARRGPGPRRVRVRDRAACSRTGSSRPACSSAPGSVMHGMNDEVNMREYGGLARVMPVTYVTFGLAYLAIIGIPPFSGFFTKDPIIEADFSEQGRHGRRILGTCAADRRGHHRVLHDPDDVHDLVREAPLGGGGRRAAREPSRERSTRAPHPHESPAGDDLADDRARDRLGGRGRVPDPQRPAAELPRPRWSGSRPPRTASVSVVGRRDAGRSSWPAVALAWVMYGRVPVPAVAPRGRPLTVAARKDLYGDAFNESVLMRPGQWLTRLSVFFDNRGVDGLVNTLAAAVGGTSGRVRKLQTGFVRSYALSMFFGAAVLVALLLVVRL